MEKAIIIPENISLFHIDIVESSINDFPLNQDSTFEIKVAHTTMHNLKDEKIKIGLLIDMQSSQNKDGNIPKANFNIDFHYLVKELNQFYKLDENNNPTFYALLIATILGISFSTARGIIFERLSNTNLKKIILPVISPRKMLETRIQANKSS